MTRLCVLVGLIGVICSSSASAQLMAYYKFEQSSDTQAIDSSGRGNHGTISTASSSPAFDQPGEPNWVEGKVGQALEFNGDLAIHLPADKMGMRSDTGSVAFWLRMDQAVLSGINTIWWGGDNDTGGGFGPENEMHIHVESTVNGIWEGGELSFSGQNTPNNFHIFSDPNKGSDPATEPNDPILMNDGQWHHVVCTWGNDDGTVKMYHNGVLLNEAPQGTRNYALSNMVIGCMENGSRMLTGVLDDVQIYGRALTVDEVVEVMNATLATTPQASIPSPGNQVTEVTLDAQLIWLSGDGAATHTVYFGTSFKDVNEATPADDRGVLKVQGLTASTYDPGALDYLQTYYWRVDEVEADGVTIHRGKVWSFTTRNFVVVDDFESYTDNEPNRIFDVWVDGWDNSEQNGAVVGYLTLDSSPGGHFAETENVHGGLQAMPLFFDTNYKYSEAYLPVASDAQDWTANEVQELSLWFKGHWALTGSYTEDSGVFHVTASGTDIWDVADECYFVYKEMTGEATIVAHVDSLVNTGDGWAKAGIMVRDTLDPGARTVGVFFTPAEGTRLQRRATEDGTYLASNETTVYVGDPNDPNTFPRWLKLERTVGGLLRAYTSQNGSSWTQFPLARSLAIMNSPVYVGLAVTSHDASVTTDAAISNVALTGAGSEADWSGADIGVDSNPPEPVFVMLNDQAVVYHNEPNAAQINEWAQWNVPLQEFADQGVDLGKVTKLTVGVGQQGDTTTAGGEGTLDVDDIRLYRSSVPVAVTVENGSFELPGTDKQTDFNNVPGWSTDGVVTDSGIEVNDTATDGAWVAYLMSGDPSLWQMTEHVVAAGDTLGLKVDARSRLLATTLRMVLYTLNDAGDRVPIVSQDVAVSDEMQRFSLSFNANDVRNAIGKTVGVELENVSDVGKSTWLEIDNVRLTLLESH